MFLNVSPRNLKTPAESERCGWGPPEQRWGDWEGTRKGEKIGRWTRGNGREENKRENRNKKPTLNSLRNNNIFVCSRHFICIVFQHEIQRTVHRSESLGAENYKRIYLTKLCFALFLDRISSKQICFSPEQSQVPLYNFNHFSITAWLQFAPEKSSLAKSPRKCCKALWALG